MDSKIRLAAGTPSEMRNLAEWLGLEDEEMTNAELLDEAADLINGRVAVLLDAIGRGDDPAF